MNPSLDTKVHFRPQRCLPDEPIDVCRIRLMQRVIHLEIKASVLRHSTYADRHIESAAVGSMDWMLLNRFADAVGKHIGVEQSGGLGDDREFLAPKAAE